MSQITLRVLAIAGGQFLAVGTGGLIHWLLFRQADESVWETLSRYPFLWILYVLVGLAVAEHLFRLLSRFAGPLDEN